MLISGFVFLDGSFCSLVSVSSCVSESVMAVCCLLSGCVSRDYLLVLKAGIVG